MDKNDRETLLGQIGVRNADDGIHVTLKNDKQRDALAESIRSANTPVSFGSNPKVFIEPSGERATT
jgi:hypothetical protein